MSEQEVVPTPSSFVVTKCPISRVVEHKDVRILQKLTIASLVDDDPDEDVLSDAYQNMVAEAAEQYLAKQVEEMVAKEGDDISPPVPDPEVEQLLEAVINDDGDYIREPKLDPITKEYISAEQAEGPHPVGERLMASDVEEPFDMEGEESYDIDPVETFIIERKPPSHIAAVNEANTKDEPYTRTEEKKMSSDSTKQAKDKGTIQYLRSVEGRVLTVLEAAFSSTEQREAVKSLIKKEFRREMNKVNQATQADEDEL